MAAWEDLRASQVTVQRVLQKSSNMMKIPATIILSEYHVFSFLKFLYPYIYFTEARVLILEQ